MLGLCTLVSAIVVAPQDPSSGLLEPVELRAEVISGSDVDALGSRRKLREHMDWLCAHGFDAVVPLVWENGRTLFPCTTLTKVSGVGVDTRYRDRDLMNEIVFEAHRAGLEVMPAVDGSFPCDSSIKLPFKAAKDGKSAHLKVEHPDVSKFARDMVRELVETYELDGLVLIGGLPAVKKSDVKSAVGKAVADSLVDMRTEIHVVDPQITIGWVPLSDPIFATAAECGWLTSGCFDFVAVRAQTPTKPIERVEKDATWSWIALNKQRGVQWLDVGALDDKSLLAMLEASRAAGLAGEFMTPPAGLQKDDEVLAKALNEGIMAPYYAPATLPWRGGISRRPHVAMIAPASGGGSGDWLDDSEGQHVLFYAKDASGIATWTVKADEAGQYDLWIWIPAEVDVAPKVTYSVAGQKTVSQITIDTTRAQNRGWVRLSRTPMAKGEERNVVRLETDASTGKATYAGPLVALLRRRPDRK